MSEATSIKSQVYMPGKGKRGAIRKQLTLEVITSWIKLQGFDEYTTNGLIELACKYPTQALPSFRRNFNLMIERVRAKRKAELQGQTQPVPPAPAVPLKQAEELKTTKENDNGFEKDFTTTKGNL
jgi:hypothetical protein